MYDPLSASYIPEIHPSNLSFVTPSPDSYLHLLEIQNKLEHYNGLGKNTSINMTISDEHTPPTDEPTDACYDDSMLDCLFMKQTSCKEGAFCLYTSTIVLLLACNIIFLVWIMKVCIEIK